MDVISLLIKVLNKFEEGYKNLNDVFVQVTLVRFYLRNLNRFMVSEEIDVDFITRVETDKCFVRLSEDLSQSSEDSSRSSKDSSRSSKDLAELSEGVSEKDGCDRIEKADQPCQYSLIMRDASFYWKKKEKVVEGILPASKIDTPLSKKKLLKDKVLLNSCYALKRLRGHLERETLKIAKNAIFDETDQDESLISLMEKDESLIRLMEKDESEYIGFKLDKIDLKIAKKTLTFVMGKIGSGKTSL